MGKRKKTMLNRMVCMLVLTAVCLVSGLGDVSYAQNRDVKQAAETKSKVQIMELKTQNLTNPIGIQTEKPVFSWKIKSEEPGQKQTAYRIAASATKEKLAAGDYDVWDSGKVVSSDNYGIVYDGRPLGSMERAYWKVLVWDKDGNETSFSDSAYWEMGLLDESDWQGTWITAGDEPVLYGDADKNPAKANHILNDSVEETTTRYLKLKVRESGPATIDEYNDGNLGGSIYRVQIMELELFHNGKKIELPANTSVTAANSFTYGDQWNAGALIDRNYSKGYTSKTAASPVYDSPIEVALDFGTDLTFDEVKLYCRTDTRSTEGEVCPNYPRKYQYMKSEDGVSFQNISDEVVVKEPPVIKKVNHILDDSVGETTTRYLKLKVRESGPATIDEYNDGNLGGAIYRVQIMELELFHNGKRIELPANTSVTAENSFTYGDQWNTGALIDRNYSKGYTSKTAASPAYDNPIEVALDFGTELTFDEVKLYCRTDTRSTEGEVCPNYPKKYQYVKSEDGVSYQNISDEIVITEPPVANGDGEYANAPILSKEFSVEKEKKVASGRLYISGLGLFEAHFNGVTLGEGTYFNPGESDVRDTVYYCTYDITDYLNADADKGWTNAVSFLLGNGQYANYRIHRQSARYYKTDDARSEKEVEGMFGAVKGIAQIVITYEDGSRTTIGTDDSWSYIESPITENSWYGGEDYDAALEIDGWDNINPALPRSKWGNAVLVSDKDVPKGRLVGREFEPISIQQADTISSEKLTVEKLSESAGNTTYLVDMGRNGAGFPEIILKDTKKGQQIRMYPAEVDEMNGFMGHINQESCTQSASKRGELIYNTYITKGGETETWHPRFCYHGYRYLEVSAPSELELTSGNFKGYILRTDNDKNGSFSSSSESLNQINVLTERSIESNMYSTFTDCPQIEKLGWLETTSLMYYSMSQTYDIRSWIPKLIQDMEDAQYDNGRIAAIAPEYFKIRGLFEDLNWNGSIILTSWQYYETYGNKEIFSGRHYQTMKNYMNYLENNVASGNLILTGQMGEWGEMTNYGKTPIELVETTAYYRMAVAMSKIANVLGESADQEHYTQLAEAIKKAFHENETCYNETNLYGNGTQSGYGCVLYSGIVLDEKREETVERLVKAIEKTDYHLTSGEVGLKQVFSALAENGRSDIIYKMVTNETMPSYQYFLDKGLTTLPEYWNFEELWYGAARSRNHAMMGHVKEWFTRYLAGVQIEDIAYDSVRIKPAVIDELDEVKGSVDTVHGNIVSNWKIDRENNTLVMEVALPAGVSASVYVPVVNADQTVICNGKKVSVSSTEAGYMLLEDVFESGSYTITAGIVKEEQKPDPVLIDISAAKAAEIAAQKYTGKALTPEVNVTYNGEELVKDTDYTVSYSDNTNIGTAKVTITGKGNYTGTLTVSFTIYEDEKVPGITEPDINKPAAVDLSTAKAAVISAQNYTGSALTPAVSVTCNGKILVKDTDYTVGYSNNRNIGTAIVTMNGKGNYKGTLTTTFEITVQKNASYTVGNYKYKITNANTNGKGAVTLTGVKNKATKNKLKKLNVAASVKIGGRKFAVTAIGSQAFSGCKAATSVTIGTKVTKIGSKAFYNCRKLKKIRIKTGILKSVGKNALKGIPKDAAITVPKNKMKKYKSLLKSKGQKKSVKIK